MHKTDLFACFYQHAANKRQAIHDIVEMRDPHAFLAMSGWFPGVVLQSRHL
jgi:hypothetical protein